MGQKTISLSKKWTGTPFRFKKKSRERRSGAFRSNSNPAPVPVVTILDAFGVSLILGASPLAPFHWSVPIVPVLRNDSWWTRPSQITVARRLVCRDRRISCYQRQQSVRESHSHTSPLTSYWHDRSSGRAYTDDCTVYDDTCIKGGQCCNKYSFPSI